MLFLKQTALSLISENSDLHFNITNCRPVGLEQQLYIKHVSGSDIRAGQQLSDGVAGEGAEEGVCGRWWWGGVLRFGCDHSFVFAEGVQPFSPARQIIAWPSLHPNSPTPSSPP